MTDSGEDYNLVEEVIFIILNFVFFGALAFFVINSASGAFVYEQIYAKEVALLIDSSEIGTTIRFDVSEGYEIASDKGFNSENMVKIENGEVVFQLSGSRGYSMGYFNDVVIEDLSYEVIGEKVYLNFRVVENE